MPHHHPMTRSGEISPPLLPVWLRIWAVGWMAGLLMAMFTINALLHLLPGWLGYRGATAAEIMWLAFIGFGCAVALPVMMSPLMRWAWHATDTGHKTKIAIFSFVAANLVLCVLIGVWASAYSIAEVGGEHVERTVTATGIRIDAETWRGPYPRNGSYERTSTYSVLETDAGEFRLSGWAIGSPETGSCRIVTSPLGEVVVEIECTQ